MQIILDPEESKAYQDQKVREAILAETSKFPASMQRPINRKPRPAPLSDESKAEIKRLHDTGMRRDQIAKELDLPVLQVGGVVQAYIMNVLRKRPVESKIEGLQPMKPLVIPGAEKPATDATCASCDKPLGRDKLAIDGKIYCGPKCAPKKVPTMITKRPKAPKSNSAIDSLIVDVSAKKQDPLDIANEINRVFGGAWLPEDVSKRLQELRSHE